MIEFVYRENAKETGPERKIELPKNVRQIGDPEDRRKIYIEDYVITYLRRLAGEETLNSRVAILLGYSERMDGLPYLFIRGAVGLKNLEYTEAGIPVSYTHLLLLQVRFRSAVASRCSRQDVHLSRFVTP